MYFFVNIRVEKTERKTEFSDGRSAERRRLPAENFAECSMLKKASRRRLFCSVYSAPRVTL